MSERSPSFSPRVLQAWKKHRHLWKDLEVPSRSVLLAEGDICRRLFLIEKGCMRQWFNHDGKEISFQFFFEGDVVWSAESFRNNTPSPFSIGSIEPVVLRWLDRQDMEIIRKDPDLYEFMIAQGVEKQAIFMRHFFSFLKDTPAQRYADLLKDKPAIIQRVPLQYIASYLGITQVSLSRIRNKLHGRGGKAGNF